MRIKPLFGRGDFEVGSRIFFGLPPEKARRGTVEAITAHFLLVRLDHREAQVVSFLHVRAIVN